VIWGELKRNKVDRYCRRITPLLWCDREAYRVEFFVSFKYLSDSVKKLIKKVIENLEEQLTEYEIYWLENNVLFIKKQSDGFGIQEIHCEDFNRYFYILSDIVCYCPYCGSTNVQFLHGCFSEGKVSINNNLKFLALLFSFGD